MNYKTRYSYAEKNNQLDHKILELMDTPEKRKRYHDVRQNFVRSNMGVMRIYRTLKGLYSVITEMDELHKTLTEADLNPSETISCESERDKIIALQNNYTGKPRSRRTWNAEIKHANGVHESTKDLPKGISITSKLNEMGLDKVRVSLDELICQYGKGSKK